MMKRFLAIMCLVGCTSPYKVKEVTQQEPVMVLKRDKTQVNDVFSIKLEKEAVAQSNTEKEFWKQVDHVQQVSNSSVGLRKPVN